MTDCNSTRWNSTILQCLDKMQCKKRSGMVDVYLLHVRKQPRFENVCVSQIYLQAALPGGMVNPLDKIGEPEDINIDVSQSRVTVRNADQQLSIALLGCCHLFICFLSYIFIPYFNSLVFVWWTNFYTILCFACKVPLSYNVFLPDPGSSTPGGLVYRSRPL